MEIKNIGPNSIFEVGDNTDLPLIWAERGTGTPVCPLRILHEFTKYLLI